MEVGCQEGRESEEDDVPRAGGRRVTHVEEASLVSRVVKVRYSDRTIDYGDFYLEGRVVEDD